MKISTILSNIELTQFALPEFQRGYVWGREDVRKFFDSLYRRYPVGGFLMWSTQPDPQTVRGDSAASGASIKLLLDGQQRATTLYGVMRGLPPEFFQGNKKAFTDLYFNVHTETFEFYGPVKMRDDPMWISVTELFRSDLEDIMNKVAEHIQQMAGQEQHFKLFLKYQGRLLRLQNIGEVDLHIEEIAGEDRTIDEVVEIFNRVNSGGTKLSAADLALARLCAHSPETRNELRRLVGIWSAAGFPFKQELLLRCATTVATNQAYFGGLKDVTVSEFSTALKSTERSINFLLNLFGDRLGIDHGRVLAGRPAFATLVRFVSERGGSIGELDTQQRMLFWYMHSFLWGRYSGAPETRIQRDLAALNRAGVDGLIAEITQWLGNVEVRPDYFASSTVGARFYPILYILTRVNAGRDLLSGIRLSHGMLGYQSKLHVHHIFPKKLLYKAGYDRSQVNALANFSFLTAESNQTISASDPAEYLPEVEAKNPGVLKSQWIPENPELWSIDNYPRFLEARRDLLAKAANQLLDTLRKGQLSTPRHSTDIAPLPLPADQPGTLDDDYEDDIFEILLMAEDLGIAEPEPHCEISDDDTGELLAVADVAWPQGIQPGRTQPVALMFDADPKMNASLGELGYRFFTSKQRLVWYLEELLGVDIDGDEVVGERGDRAGS